MCSRGARHTGSIDQNVCIGNKVRVGLRVGRESWTPVTLNFGLVRHLWRLRENPEVRWGGPSEKGP